MKKHPPRRFASPPTRGAALAVWQSQPGGALGWSGFVRDRPRFGAVENR
jgi:hypothetical protein